MGDPHFYPLKGGLLVFAYAFAGYLSLTVKYIFNTEPVESKNLIPANGEEKEEVWKDGESRTFVRQFPADRKWLINNFFNSEDKDYLKNFLILV